MLAHGVGDLGEKVPGAHPPPPELTAAPGDGSLLSCMENSVTHTGLEICRGRPPRRPRVVVSRLVPPFGRGRLWWRVKGPERKLFT